jgi:hypothetical protein
MVMMIMVTTLDPTVLDRLASYRLAHDLTFKQLATAMQQAGYPVQARALHFALTNRLLRAPRDRTLYKIQQFLETPGVDAWDADTPPPPSSRSPTVATKSRPAPPRRSMKRG